MGNKVIKFDPYQYQRDCLNIIIKRLLSKDMRHLVQLPTGGGKTIIFAHLIKFLLKKNPKMRVLVLAHRSKLIEQARDKLLDVWPSASDKTGIYCASLSTKKKCDMPITIASIQSIHGHVEEMEPFHLTIIDEAHKISPANMKSQYTDVISALEALTKYHNLLGFTATPWRSGHGYIFGDEKRPDRDNYFEDLCYSYKLHDLIKKNRLSKYRLFCAENSSLKGDLKTVPVSKGEFNNSALTKVMIRTQHLESIPNSIYELAMDRNSIAVFCASIEHIENVALCLNKTEFKYGIYHSKQSKTQNEQVLKDFESFKIQILLSIDKLTEGYDNDRIDCLIDAAGTMSSAKWLQRLGRGLRWHILKGDCLIIDLACNINRHLSLNNPKVNIPGIPEGDREPPYKKCPECKYMNFASALKCKNDGCSYVYPLELHQYTPDLKLVEYISPKERKSAKPSSTVLETHGSILSSHRSVNRNLILTLTIYNIEFGGNPTSVIEFLDFSGAIGFMTVKSMKLWTKLTVSNPPRSNAAALARKNELLAAIPKKIEIMKLKQKVGDSKTKKYWKVVCWGVSPWNE